MGLAGVVLIILGLVSFTTPMLRRNRYKRKSLTSILGVVLTITGGLLVSQAGPGTQSSTTAPSSPSLYHITTRPSLAQLQGYLGDGGNALAYKEVTHASRHALQDVKQFQLGSISSSQLDATLQSDFQIVQNTYQSYGLQQAPADLLGVDKVLRSNAKNQILYIGYLKNAAQNSDAATLSKNAESLQAYIRVEQSVQSQLVKLQERLAATQGATAATYPVSGPQQVSVGGGLGDTISVIEKYYGKPTQVISAMKNGTGSYNFGSDISVSFEDGRAYLFQREFTGSQAHYAMQTMSGTAIPKDSSTPSSTQNTSGGFLGVYQSQTLAKVFPPNLFIGPGGLVPAGTYTLAEMQVSGDTTISLSIGENS